MSILGPLLEKASPKEGEDVTPIVEAWNSLSTVEQVGLIGSQVIIWAAFFFIMSKIASRLVKSP
ncbi:MAG: hypothetical protein AAB439_03815 [Patescibacteria group bacterium]